MYNTRNNVEGPLTSPIKIDGRVVPLVVRGRKECTEGCESRYHAKFPMKSDPSSSL